ncbi:Gamma-aminobutyric acid receptor alpha-like [Nymphon striatum]|nr:Gamma-aminobutyric acid receptor alpha-like [Nymphon striatum]
MGSPRVPIDRVYRRGRCVEDQPQRGRPESLLINLDEDVEEFFCQAVFNLSTSKLELSDIFPSNMKVYDKMRPPKKDGRPTKVDFHVTVMSLDSIDEGKMTFMADIFFGQTWQDHRLQLPANMTEEYRLLEVEWLQHLWSPDSFFKNAKQVTFQKMSIPNHYLWLYRSKSILYMVK